MFLVLCLLSQPDKELVKPQQSELNFFRPFTGRANPGRRGCVEWSSAALRLILLPSGLLLLLPPALLGRVLAGRSSGAAAAGSTGSGRGGLGGGSRLLLLRVGRLRRRGRLLNLLVLLRRW